MQDIDFSEKFTECDYCEKPMSPGNGCSHRSFISDSNTVEARLPFDDQDSQFCPDCNVAGGQLHHPFCDVEECPICHGQVISCGHFFDSEYDEDDLWDDDEFDEEEDC